MCVFSCRLKFLKIRLLLWKLLPLGCGHSSRSLFHGSALQQLSPPRPPLQNESVELCGTLTHLPTPNPNAHTDTEGSGGALEAPPPESPHLSYITLSHCIRTPRRRQATPTGSHPGASQTAAAFERELKAQLDPRSEQLHPGKLLQLSASLSSSPSSCSNAAATPFRTAHAFMHVSPLGCFFFFFPRTRINVVRVPVCLTLATERCSSLIH